MSDRLNYVGGEWTPSESDETFEVLNPADPSEVVSVFPDSTSGDAQAAVDAAVGASESWAETPGPTRGKILRETAKLLEDRREDLVELLVREEGKTPAEAGEVGRAIDIFYYYAEKASDLGGTRKSSASADTDLYTVVEPVGTVGLITPWNYPIAIPAWKLAPALAAGNTAVLKPAPEAPSVAHELVSALDDAGVPDGVVNLVAGGAEPARAVVDADGVDAVSFTGSAAVGSEVYERASTTGKRAQTEMGGKNPVVVSGSADVERAADVAAAGAFGVTGQACTATSRVIVQEDHYDEFVAAVVERAESIEIGPTLDGADMGPQISEEELERTLDYVDVATTEGATLETGGGTPPGLDGGHFVEPTVFSDVTPDMRIAREEVFGPVLAVIPVADYAEGVAVANDVDYGLAASLVTDDHAEAKRFVQDVTAGVVKINDQTTGLELHVPFGGFKDSSSETWREQGDAGLDFYTITKTVYDAY